MASYEERGPGGGSDRARQMVSGPATALLVTAIIGIALQAIGLIMRLAGIGFLAAQQQGAGVEQAQWIAYMQGTGAMVSGIIGLAIGILVAIGATKMKNLESYSLAMTASILAMIPCVSPCCLLGLPFGIWAVVVLGKSEVKSAFH
jgi:hypothetical protein